MLFCLSLFFKSNSFISNRKIIYQFDKNYFSKVELTKLNYEIKVVLELELIRRLLQLLSFKTYVILLDFYKIQFQFSILSFKLNDISYLSFL